MLFLIRTKYSFKSMCVCLRVRVLVRKRAFEIVMRGNGNEENYKGL